MFKQLFFVFAAALILYGCDGEVISDPAAEAEFYILNASNFPILSACVSEDSCEDISIEPGERTLAYRWLGIGFPVPLATELVPEFFIRIDSGNNQAVNFSVPADQWQIDSEESDYIAYLYTLVDQNMIIDE